VTGISVDIHLEELVQASGMMRSMSEGLSADAHLQELVEKVMAASAGEELLGLLHLPQLHSHQAQPGIRLCHSAKLPALIHAKTVLSSQDV